MPKMRLSDLICEPLAMDVRYVPQLMGDIMAEQTAKYENDPKERPLIMSTLYDRNGHEIQAAAGDESVVRPGSLTAVVPLMGVITRHGYATWGGRVAGTSQLARHLTMLDADPAIGSIVLNVNSPGGSVYGTEELASVLAGIRDRGQTHTSSVADPLMASAATWIGTAVDEVAAIPSADVGSIGVISMYSDYSAYLEKMGVKVDVIRTPDKKARFTGIEAMTDDMRETITTRNEAAYSRFVAAMARNRRVSEDDVKAKFGGGEVMNASEAVTAGMIDRVATLDQVIAERVAAANTADPRVAKHRRRMNAIG